MAAPVCFDSGAVTLFVTGQLMRLSTAGWSPGDEPVAPVEIASSLAGPRTVLARPDGSLWRANTDRPNRRDHAVTTTMERHTTSTRGPDER